VSALDEYTANGQVPPSNHSPFFAPDDPEGTITQAAEAMTSVALDILSPAEGE
jgi:hippurate hydrolase